MSTPPDLTDNRTPITPHFEPGFFTESSARGAPSRWKTGNKVRFKNGQPEKLGGWVAQTFTGATHRGVPRRAHEWSSLDGENWIAYGTNSKLYLLNRGIRYDITPVRRSINLTNPFTTTNLLATVVVTDAGHSVQIGDSVRFSGATAVGGITISGEYVVTNVFDGNTYQITHTAAASSSATGGGTVAAQYDINSGAASQGLALGWGVCVYNESTYGTPRNIACSTVIRPLALWSLDNFGEDLIASPRGGAVYHWDKSTGPLSRAVILPDAPQTNQRVLISNSGGQIVCLGAYDDVSATPDPMFIRVGAEESLTDFRLDEDDTVYEERLATGSKIIGGVRTRSGILVCTDTAVYLMQEDATQVFIANKLAEGNSLIAPNAIIEVDGTAFLMSPNKFMKFDGVYQEIPCEVWQEVFVTNAGGTGGINRNQTDKITCWYNDKFSEIWWFYPSADSTENNRYVVFNKELGCWYFGTIERTANISSGPTYGSGSPAAFMANGTLNVHERGTDDNTAAIDAYIESHDIELGEGKTQMLVSKTHPDMVRIVGTVLLYLKGKDYPQSATYVTKGPYSITATTKKRGVRISARQCAVRYRSIAVGDEWRLGDWTYYVAPDQSR